MLRHRARVGRTRVVVRPHLLVAGLLLALLLGTLTGCGGADNEPAKAEEPSKDAVSCREQWKDLETKVAGRSSRTNPSALAPRWNSIAATVVYYATSATGDDCGATLDAQERAIDDLTAFAARLAPYDMEQQLEVVRAGAEAYAAAPRPPAPKPTKKGDRNRGEQQKSVPAPKPADIAKALNTLNTQAPLATQQQRPGWQQAHVTDLSARKAIAKAVKDLAFLSRESSAYRACTAALKQIRTALKAGAS